MSAAPPFTAPYISEQDYLAGEKDGQVRHEYVEGQVFAIAGASKRHNRIAGNIYRAFINAHQACCEAYIGDIKVRIAERKRYYYPDVVVGCAEDDNADEHYLEKPCLIVEVLSTSTERRDTVEKLLAYQSIRSLKVYLLVAQGQPCVDMLYPEADGRWWLRTFTRLEDTISLPCPEMVLSLATIYESIAFAA